MFFVSGTLRVTVAAGVLLAAVSLSAAERPDVRQLADEIAGRGWIVFAAHPLEVNQGIEIKRKEERGQSDLYVARPDGSQLRNITNTEELSEYGGRFSPDGKRLLYFRVPKVKQLNHDLWGQFGEVVVADADGSNPQVYGAEGQYPWASWNFDGTQISCLYKSEGKIRIYDVATKKMLREMPNQGIYQQMFWSSDGRQLVGTANVAGRQWNIVAVDLESQKLTVLSRGGAGSCTPDWFPNDPRRVIYSHRIQGITPRLGEQANNYGFTVLMQATTDGKKRDLVFGKLWRHVYFACVSPDGKYVVFSDDVPDTILVGAMHLIRLADTPIVAPEPAFPELKELYPNAKEGPILDLKLPGGAPLRGFEPHWTSAEIGQK